VLLVASERVMFVGITQLCSGIRKSCYTGNMEIRLKAFSEFSDFAKNCARCVVL
jgi:hypothetical protein